MPRLLVLGGLLLGSSACWLAGAQAQVDSSGQGGVAAVPVESRRLLFAELTQGLNAGVSVAGVHDSGSGWYAIATPFLTYTFTPHYSADASVSVYPYRYATVAATAGGTTLRFDGGDVGDTLLEAHGVFAPGRNRLIGTMSLTAPTGNRPDGLGTGRVTFSLDERVEHYFARGAGQTGLLLDVGGGDSTGLQNRLVTQDDVSLGPLGLFQAGVVSAGLPLGMSVQSVAYEQLPLGDQKTYRTEYPFHEAPRTVVTGRKVTEDNGFTTTLYLPLTPRVMLTGAYNRSLRLHLDTVSAGFTFVWKGTPLRRHESLIDRAMREAERGSQ